MTFEDLRRPPLDAAALVTALTRAGSLWRDVEVVDESPSTNAALAEAARAGAEEGLVLVAEHQTSGRGRLDRAWVTPARAAVTMSFLLRPGDVPGTRWPWLPLLTGIAVSEAVRRLAGVDSGLKWPNDVLVGDRKLAGILVERVESGSSGTPAAVVGIGLNVSTTRDELPVETATSLGIEAPGSAPDRTVVVREVLRTFEALYDQWRHEHGDPMQGLLDSYVRRCVTLGRQVRVDLPAGEQVTGEATAVDAEGRLLVSTEAGMRTLAAGDVVHVRAV